MKYKLMAFVLALTVVSWAQTTTQTTPASPEQSTKPSETKAACPCCDKMASAETKDAHSCCADHNMAAKDGKEAAAKDKPSCCDGKDGMSCKRSTDKTAEACCGGEKCGKDGEKGCCASDKKGEKTAMNCCQGDHCAAHAHAGE